MTPQRFLFPMLLTTLILTLALLLAAGQTARAEGSRDLFPNGATGNRANLEWRTSSYGGGLLTRRTLLKVYAEAGEYILVGSSAVGVSNGDIVIYPPGRVNETPVGQETVPTPNPLPSPGTDFLASSQAGKGKITSRNQELAGPKSADGTQSSSPNCYTPASYAVTQTGIYDVVFYGPDGESSSNEPSINGSIDIGQLGDANTTNNFGAGQKSSVTAWDVTVRSDASSTTDLPGRLFCSYLTMNVGGNGRPLHSTVYAVTTDGFQYQIALNGLDPYGFVIYGNQIGFLDDDGTSPLYHDVLATTTATNRDQLTSIQGGVSLSLPSYPLFFNRPDSAGLFDAGVASAPTMPQISALSFTGSVGGNSTRFQSGGTFSFTSNISAVYDIILSRDGINFDPTLPGNRRLRGVRGAGGNTVTWDGKDNSGAYFPVGTGYGVQAIIHGGEYHFPLLDAENSLQGGPSITLINSNQLSAPNPLGNSQGFYDDRGYRTTKNGNYVTSDGTSATVGQVIATGGTPPNPYYSDPVNGYNTTGLSRKYGDGGGGGFGDKKGLDLWTYYPSNAAATTFNVQGAPTVLLVKRITAVNGTPLSGFSDDPGTTDDNSPYWPTPAATYLRGALTVSNVKPGDELEYTIYFLVTNGPTTNFVLNDLLPATTTFEDKAYNGLTPTDGGTTGADSGIALALDAATLPTAPTVYLSNIADGDRGQFVGGSVTVKPVTSPATLPAATGPGTPANSYGFLRFRVRVK